jgi:hypothetical protein
LSGSEGLDGVCKDFDHHLQSRDLRLHREDALFVFAIFGPSTWSRSSLRARVAFVHRRGTTATFWPGGDVVKLRSDVHSR